MTRPTQTPASNSTARKRATDAHQIHHDPAVCALVERERRAAAVEAWDEGFDAGERDVLNHEQSGWNPSGPCIKNPYRYPGDVA